MTILNKVALYCEVDSTTAYDDQLLLLINNGIGVLASAGIPVTPINDTTEDFEDIKAAHQPVVITWLCLNTLRIFDKSMADASVTTQSWIDDELTRLFQSLKALYDRGGE